MNNVDKLTVASIMLKSAEDYNYTDYNPAIDTGWAGVGALAVPRRAGGAAAGLASGISSGVQSGDVGTGIAGGLGTAGATMLGALLGKRVAGVGGRNIAKALQRGAQSGKLRGIDPQGGKFNSLTDFLDGDGGPEALRTFGARPRTRPVEDGTLELFDKQIHTPIENMGGILGGGALGGFHAQHYGSNVRDRLEAEGLAEDDSLQGFFRRLMAAIKEKGGEAKDYLGDLADRF